MKKQQQLFTPWRQTFITRDKKNEGCAFCIAQTRTPDDPENLIVARGTDCFVIMNLYPYTSGHLMVIPCRHTSDFASLAPETLNEMMTLAQKATQVLTQLYHPDGFNMGMNIGRSGGAGIAQHLHLHIVPRWNGDSNFLSIVGQTRILAETVGESYLRIREAWLSEA